MSFQIAIDGPAGAGKSTIAKAVAKKLEFIYVDTGAMYRALALFCLKNQAPAEDEALVCALCEKAVVSISYIEGEQQIFLDGENVSGEIRKPEVGDMASAISVYKDVRAKMVKLQQELAASADVIMDGRDIASCVLPNADVKVYLDADVNVRAKRRVDELLAKGMEADFEDILSQMKERDYRDMHRDNSPLVRVPEATLVDSSNMTPEEVVETIINLVNKAREIK